jgi:excisionase family DNA binding protein
MTVPPLADVEQIERLVPAKIIAGIFGNSPEWWLRKARSGDIKHVRLGRSVRFRLSEVHTYIEAETHRG